MNKTQLHPLAIENVGRIIIERRILDIPAELLMEEHIIFTGLNGYKPSIDKILINDELQPLLIQTILETYDLPRENIVSSRRNVTAKDVLQLHNKPPEDITLFLRKDLILTIDDKNLSVFYTNGEYVSFREKIIALVKRLIQEQNQEVEKFQLILSQGSGYSIKRFRLKPYNINIEDNYNDDFLPVHQRIMNDLNDTNHKGLVLLHGEPGTGKTTYIRYLSRQLKKRIIFIPPQFSVSLDADAFIKLLSKYPDSIVIIEDADNIIADRKSGNNISIPGLLNIADGLLSYYLKIKIICTFNSNLSAIDPALMRRGRLIALYEFKKLKMSKALKLCEKLKIPLNIEKDTTLADIYAYRDIAAGQALINRIGFN
ncbi:MAG: AAA family ATPase [Cyclobacteriaceae bacterium]